MRICHAVATTPDFLVQDNFTWASPLQAAFAT